ncbi:MAG: adenine deaminase [Clostridia bacterium]|nr:adenine deaminase [Clostridia bacterium]
MNAGELSRLIPAARSGKPDFVIRDARVINVFTNEITETNVAIADGTIIGVGNYSCEREYNAHGAYLAPGFIDGHVHIESSMVTPASFAQVILPKGTTTIIADPHEIANVAGKEGLRAIFALSEGLPLDIRFMLPSCVPATPFEHSGATLSAADLAEFLNEPNVLGLGEVMDYPSVVAGMPDMLDKLALFSGRPIDGHAPMLTGKALNAYCLAGPQTDHECSNFSELKEKLRNGMYILIRMGSAANGVLEMFDGIVSAGLPTDRICFCTDDKHLENIRSEGHINHIINTAISRGIRPLEAIRMATLNTATAFGLKRVGAIAPGYRANLVLFDDLHTIVPKAVFANGALVDPDAPIPSPAVPESVKNSVHAAPIGPDDLKLKAKTFMPIIETVPHQLVTRLVSGIVPADKDGYFLADDWLNKLAVIERHHASGHIGVGIVEGMHIKGGAIAATVAHDSHNIVVVGDNDADMRFAAETLQACGGGFTVVSHGAVMALLELPVAGLMSDAPVGTVLEKQRALLDAAHALGADDACDPLVLLSFLALPVIPEVRLTDCGLFDVRTMSFLYQNER